MRLLVCLIVIILLIPLIFTIYIISEPQPHNIFGPSYIIKSPGTVIGSGSIINITTGNEFQLPSDCLQPFYVYNYLFSSNGNYTLKGSWTSTEKSVVWVRQLQTFYYAVPLPVSLSGSVDTNVSSGNYSITFEGIPNDTIFVTEPIRLVSDDQNHTVFMIPSNTFVDAKVSLINYQFFMPMNGSFSGTFYANGMFQFILSSRFSTTVLSSYQKSNDQGPFIFTWNIPEGRYNLTFMLGSFIVSRSITAKTGSC
ncbi:MAG: hypothetical protein M1402_03355 [Candidatus Thermoplasmatota archaeon]|nr:hypothetical protein [Candidatus Thermoplasmatota archaeon]